MAQTVSLSANPRQATGKGAARQARFGDKVPREVEIEVLPENIPDRVELDVNALKIGDSLHVRDLSIPNAKILTEADLTIATVVPPRAEEVAAPTPETATEVAEPELIRKVR